jgi:hypothetical protein
MLGPPETTIDVTLNAATSTAQWNSLESDFEHSERLVKDQTPLRLDMWCPGTTFGSVNPLRFIPACGLLIGGLLSCFAREDRVTFDRLLGRARRSCRCLCLRMCIRLFCGDYWEDIRDLSEQLRYAGPGGRRRQLAWPLQLRFGRRRNAGCSAVWHALPNQFGDGIGTTFEKPSGP